MYKSWKMASLVAIVCLHSNSYAEIVYESSSLGQTDLTVVDLLNQSIPGYNVRTGVFQGVRFQLDKPVSTTAIGGHFVAYEGGGTFFGALVSLTDVNDFPDSADFSSPDVLGIAELTFPDPSGEVFGVLNVDLQPGWFALMFGSGLFSTTGVGATVGNGIDIGSPSYFGAQPIPTDPGWSHFPNSLLGERFVLLGSVVPEASTSALLGICGIMLLVKRRRAD